MALLAITVSAGPINPGRHIPFAGPGAGDKDTSTGSMLDGHPAVPLRGSAPRTARDTVAEAGVTAGSRAVGPAATEPQFGAAAAPSWFAVTAVPASTTTRVPASTTRTLRMPTS